MAEVFPVACSLTGAEVNSRRDRLLPGLAARAVGTILTADGCELVFEPAPGILADIAAVIDAERQCCRFLRFDVGVAPAGGPIRMTLSGPPGTREFLASLVEV